MEPAESRDPLSRGEILAGKYRVERLIGEGGMGQVFAAEHVQLGHRVALKVLRASALESQEAVQRFLREARAAASLRSDHVAHVSDVGTLESGAPYMVMELLEGEDLAQLIPERGPLPIAEAVDYMLQACEALADAHCHGIVHRDLKPANLFLTIKVDGKPFIKVLDFGISKANEKILGGQMENITSTAAMIGSPKYMSPEQMQDSRNVDARADIWALGAILYELLTGKRAFDGSTLATTCVQILEKEPAPPRSIREDIPVLLEAVILRCLRKDPKTRFDDVSALAKELAPFAEDAETMVFRISKLLHAANAQATTSSMPPMLGEMASLRGVQTPSSRTSIPDRADRAERRKEASATPSARKSNGGSNAPPVVVVAPMGKRGWAAVGVALVALFVLAFLVFRGPQNTGDPRAPQIAAAVPSVLPASSPLPSVSSAVSLVANAPESAIDASAPTSSVSAAASGASSAKVPSPIPRRPRPAVPAHAKPSRPAGVGDSVLEDRR